MHDLKFPVSLDEDENEFDQSGSNPESSIFGDFEDEEGDPQENNDSQPDNTSYISDVPNTEGNQIITPENEREIAPFNANENMESQSAPPETRPGRPVRRRFNSETAVNVIDQPQPVPENNQTDRQNNGTAGDQENAGDRTNRIPKKGNPDEMVTDEDIEKFGELLTLLYHDIPVSAIDLSFSARFRKIPQNFIKVKFGIQRTNFNINKRGAYKVIRKLQMQPERRNGDKYRKFIFKNTLKSLKEKFLKEHSFRRSLENSKKFWEHHFADQLRKGYFTVEELYDPLIKQNELQDGQRVSINPHHINITKAYLRNFLTNPRFTKLFTKEIDICLSEDRYFEKKKNALLTKLRIVGIEAFNKDTKLSRPFLFKKQIEERKLVFNSFFEKSGDN